MVTVAGNWMVCVELDNCNSAVLESVTPSSKARQIAWDPPVRVFGIQERECRRVRELCEGEEAGVEATRNSALLLTPFRVAVTRSQLPTAWALTAKLVTEAPVGTDTVAGTTRAVGLEEVIPTGIVPADFESVIVQVLLLPMRSWVGMQARDVNVGVDHNVSVAL